MDLTRILLHVKETPLLGALIRVWVAGRRRASKRVLGVRPHTDWQIPSGQRVPFFPKLHQLPLPHSQCCSMDTIARMCLMKKLLPGAPIALQHCGNIHTITQLKPILLRDTRPVPTSQCHQSGQPINSMDQLRLGTARNHEPSTDSSNCPSTPFPDGVLATSQWKIEALRRPAAFNLNGPSTIVGRENYQCIIPQFLALNCFCNAPNTVIEGK
mmetsp:Transcript_40033/g.89928  ORF Transcript_40033/g.89928 Transcript_40033/m.89928 type:complete len:213 (-) Transcript_40033:737-1375(-)